MGDFLIVLLIDNQDWIVEGIVTLIGLGAAGLVRKFQLKKGGLAAQAVSVAERMATEAVRNGQVIDKATTAIQVYKASKGPAGRLRDRLRKDGGEASAKKAFAQMQKLFGELFKD